MATMMRGSKISKLICFSISGCSRQHQSLSRTRHHVDSPLLRLFSSSSNTNTASSEVNKSDLRKSESNSPYVPFDDDGQKPPISRVDDDKIEDVDGFVAGFVDGFKLGFDQEENKPHSDKLDSIKGTGEVADKLDSIKGTGEVADKLDSIKGTGEVADKLDSIKGTGEGEAVAEAPPPPPSPPEDAPPEDADEIFRKMKETGLIPSAAAMIKGLCSDGLVEEAMKLSGLLCEKKSIPEVVVYTAVVEGFCKSQKPDEAMKIFKEMQKNGVIPNAYSYGVLLQGLCKGKRLDEALEFCVEMVEAGHKPNLVTFTGLVDGFCRERGLEAAEIMVSNLKEKGLGYDEKAVRDFMEKEAPFLPLVWEAIIEKKEDSQI